MVILSGIMLVLAFPPFPFAFLAYFAFVPLLLVIDHTPNKTFEDRFWGFFKALLITPWRLLTRPFLLIGKKLFPASVPGELPPILYQRKIISHNAQVFRYAYTAFIIWNFGCGYWLMLTAMGAQDFAETLTNLISGLLANVLNPFLMAIPIYFYTKVRWKVSPLIGGLSLIFFWITFEWLHFNWDLSWSWLTLGHCMSYYPIAIQYMEFTGIFGVSLHILLINVLIYTLLHALNDGKKPLAGILGGSIVLIVALPFVLNVWILNPHREVFQSQDALRVRVIQPNIDPYEKFEQATQEQQVARFDSLIRQPGIDTIDLVILPETAIPKGIWNDQIRTDPLIEPLWQIVETEDLSLLTGLTEYRFFDPLRQKVPASARPYRTGFADGYNASAMLIKGQDPETFQKGKLVPMVERMPFLETFTFLKEYNIDLGGNFGNYGVPDSIRNLRTHQGVDVASLICYESEYGEYVTEFVRKGARMLIIITNDGWWQRSSGHIQHAYFTTFRAIETRRAVARSANTGISLFSDNRGQISQPTIFWTATYIDARMPLYDSLTFYVRHGDYIGWLCGLGSLMLTYVMALWALWQKGQAGETAASEES